ncbi:lipocalin-like domain-containing protein [Paracoccus albus]|uniref:lipocalin-like domain-containing protein n=1 Tax=Paracoccus albus TaxID=3017784 RepID=UPI0022EFF074|nr:lipocalin-like domain-containing protein [Paracoccus albus]WBU61919.1 iron ABC transporter permease [Paracoccus albus]
MDRRGFILALLSSGPAYAQGFAGLGADANGFALPDAQQPISFPRDHGPHPDYRIEWWYLTAPLQFTDGTPLGIQWTLFRISLEPPSKGGRQVPQVWMGHAALTTRDRHLFAERFARGGTGQAGATGKSFEAWIDEWQMAGETPDRLSLTAGGTDFSYDLELIAEGPLIRHGAEGYSRKSASGQASYYYSQPFYRVRGKIDLGQGARDVSGQGWLDREWSSQPLSADQAGWDWFSLFLADGRKLMLFRLRGSSEYRSGTLIAADGTTTSLGTDQIKLTAGDKVKGIPTAWRVEVPHQGIDLQVEALNPGAWMGTRISYWEGPVNVNGSATGRGYLEMTGYEWGGN